jgi:hypothetical protein
MKFLLISALVVALFPTTSLSKVGVISSVEQAAISDDPEITNFIRRVVQETGTRWGAMRKKQSDTPEQLEAEKPAAWHQCTINTLDETYQCVVGEFSTSAGAETQYRRLAILMFDAVAPEARALGVNAHGWTFSYDDSINPYFQGRKGEILMKVTAQMDLTGGVVHFEVRANQRD